MSKFTQLCVWPGCTISNCNNDPMNPCTGDVREFEDWMREEFGVKVKYEGTVKTKPDKDKFGHYIEGTGGRMDLFFYVADEDVMKFAVPRLGYGIRWWEDVGEYNKGADIYPSQFVEEHPYMW